MASCIEMLQNFFLLKKSAKVNGIQGHVYEELDEFDSVWNTPTGGGMSVGVDCLHRRAQVTKASRCGW